MALTCLCVETLIFFTIEFFSFCCTWVLVEKISSSIQHLIISFSASLFTDLVFCLMNTQRLLLMMVTVSLFHFKLYYIQGATDVYVVRSVVQLCQ